MEVAMNTAFLVLDLISYFENKKLFVEPFFIYILPDLKVLGTANRGLFSRKQSSATRL